VSEPIAGGRQQAAGAADVPRVVVADDQALVRGGFRLILNLAGIPVVAEAADGKEAVAVVLGLIIGVLPGLGGTSGVAILLPVTVFIAHGSLPGSDATTAIIFLAGIYWGALFGGVITSILFNIPGTPMAAASAFDGYPMAMKGEGARALAASSLSAFIAGTVCIIMFTLFARPVAEYALTWGPPEYFSVMIVAYAALAGLGIVAHGSAITVIHGMGENSARIVVLFVLRFAALVSTRTSTTGPATTPAAPSLPTVAGGMLRSKSHDALFSPARALGHGLR